MTKVPSGGRTVFADDPDEDDTIEMELSPQDMRRLAQAAEEHYLNEEPLESPPRSPSNAGAAKFESSDRGARETQGPASSATLELEALASSVAPVISRRNPPKGVSSATLGRGALTGAAGALLVVLAIASWSAAHRASPLETASAPIAQVAPAAPSHTAGAAPTRSAAAPQATAAPATPPEFGPIRIKNPFDRSEVFEFPPGTTREEARQSVADVLMQRARDRHVPTGTPPHRRINGPDQGIRPAKNTDLAQNTVLRR